MRFKQLKVGVSCSSFNRTIAFAVVSLETLCCPHDLPGNSLCRCTVHPLPGFKDVFFFTPNYLDLLYFVLFLWQARATFVSELEQTEDWLYEEGDDQSKKVYQEKLDALKVTRHDWSKGSHI